MSAQIKPINMPKWGMEMAEGDINSWHVEIGAQVNAGDDLVDVETSKIVNTVTATNSGILRAIVGQPGDTLAVGALLGVLADANTSDADIQAFIASHTAAAAPAESSTPAEKSSTPAEKSSPPAAAQATTAAPAPAKADTKPNAPDAMSKLAAGADDSGVAASPVARRLAAEYGVNLNNISATGRHGRVSKRDLDAAVSAAGGQLIGAHTASSSHAPRYPDDSTVKATPVARRLARDLGINLHQCRVSGDRGRVCKADVEAAAALHNKLQAKPSSTATEVAVEEAFELQAMSGMRKTIAARLQASKQTAPHFRVQIDAELDALLAVRKQLNDANTNAKISVNDFIVKACASALTRVPAINVQFDGEQVKYFRDADISVAVAIDEGLITPIVKQANSKGLIAISNEVRDLATRAKLNRLKPNEFQGGSFCISNLGMFGIKQFDAIINPPQGAILAVGAGEQRPVVKNGQLAVATVVSLTLSSDHRIIDGAVAAQFMSVLKGYLEQPATMLG
ncbi:2-oxo acid dehydrogenase subunit E2 [Pseudomaricurvus alcaniphilus]|uniref:2-oxo acid dehydrogenase subunit E2 n=1 Tax=Pseudomaricurvus alcaniphilus TaxID=1166482 RepID=UPI001408E270|nr:2-oxo acid dehydrogenase subunit E2 [Pseudomaricurvus alcaniphilus]NHN39221.1 2-oxo acid dehydrogenase subunit E2 [Pseudomaricurvus alcaniphilus]